MLRLATAALATLATICILALPLPLTAEVTEVPTISSLYPINAPAGGTDTDVTITGTGFVDGSQVIFDGIHIATYNGPPTSQFTFTIPEPYLAAAGPAQVYVANPLPNGGKSNTVIFTVYQPVSYAVKTTSFRYNKITGTNLNLTYSGSAGINSPFPIEFGGGSYTKLTVGPGGTISFTGFASQNHDVIPTSQVPMLVAPFWADLYPWGTGTDNNVFWAVQGTAPTRKLVVEWRNVGYCCSGDPTHTVRFEVVFTEGSGKILFSYLDGKFGGPDAANNFGATATAGVQVAPGLGTQFSYNQPVLLNKTSLLWYPSQAGVLLSTSALDFGYHMVGTWSLAKKFTVTNGGLVPLHINGISFDSPDFRQSNNCGTELLQGKTCTVKVEFNPGQPVPVDATLTIDDDGIGAPHKVTLHGMGTEMNILVYPLVIHYGQVPVGEKRVTPVIMANAANRDLTIQLIRVIPEENYTQTNDCGAAVAPGLYCTITITFTPTQVGPQDGKLRLAIRDDKEQTWVNMYGSGK